MQRAQTNQRFKHAVGCSSEKAPFLSMVTNGKGENWVFIVQYCVYLNLILRERLASLEMQRVENSPLWACDRRGAKT